MKKLTFSIVAVFFSFLVSGQSLQVEIEGNATFDNSLFTISEAGNDFPASIKSKAAIYISIVNYNYLDKKNNKNNKWNIEINKADLIWDDNLKLEAKRKGKGHNFGKKRHSNIQGGSNFQVITNNGIEFFKGKGEIENIPIKLKLSGFSITMGAKDFETNIVFTVYDD